MNNFNAYEAFKMACVTCNRTLKEVDGMEMSSKLLWCMLSLYQAITYAMLFNKNVWEIEKNTLNTFSVTDAIKKSVEFDEIPDFCKKFCNLSDPDEYNRKIYDVEGIRNNVMHANAPQLERWGSDVSYLIELMDICIVIITEIVEFNDKELNNSDSKKMREWWQMLGIRLSNTLAQF